MSEKKPVIACDSLRLWAKMNGSQIFMPYISFSIVKVVQEMSRPWPNSAVSRKRIKWEHSVVPWPGSNTLCLRRASPCMWGAKHTKLLWTKWWNLVGKAWLCRRSEPWLLDPWLWHYKVVGHGIAFVLLDAVTRVVEAPWNTTPVGIASRLMIQQRGEQRGRGERHARLLGRIEHSPVRERTPLARCQRPSLKPISPASSSKRGSSTTGRTDAGTERRRGHGSIGGTHRPHAAGH